MTPWSYLDECSIHSKINFITVDTRDFFVLLIQRLEMDFYNLDNTIFEEVAKDDRYLIEQDDILPFLKELETISGGKGEWRFLEFKHIDTKSGWGFKYLRLYRIDNHRFIIANNDNEPVEWRLLTKENVCDDLLNFSEI